MAAPGRPAAPGSGAVPAPVRAAEPGLRGQNPPRPAGTGQDEIARIAERLGIGGLLDDRPARLSGGQAHRVALGRLLASRCDALLLDEPYSGLDASLTRDLTDLVREVVAARQVPSVLVAHELEAAQAFADQMAVLDQGQILQLGPPAEVVAAPAARRVAELVGYRAFVPLPGDPGTVAGVHPDRVVPGRQPGRGVVLAGPVRSCRPAGAGWEATIEMVTIETASAETAGAETAGAETAGAETGGAGAGGTLVPVRLREAPAGGGDFTFTVLAPPCFRPDGTRVTRAEEVPT